jgi:hypothetical protein
MRMRISPARALGVVVALSSALFAVGCSDDETKAPGPIDPDVTVGATALIAIVNPVPNAGHNTGVPAEAGDERSAITVKADPGGEDVTEAGIAVVPVAPGALNVHVGPTATLPLTVIAAGDVYDAPIAYNGSGAAYFANTPIRYPVGKASGAIFFGITNPLSEIEAQLGLDDSVVVLAGGVYKGNLTIEGTGVLVYGEGFTEHDVIIEGSLTVNGSNVRVRGVTITGDLSAKGNDFGISFSLVKGTTSITGNGGAFVQNVFCGSATVPSSNATLLDNFGVEPLTALPAGACD